MDSETSLGGLEDVLINHASHASNGADESSLQQHVATADGAGHNPSSMFGPPMTPIDKLYSMQTSYFSANDCECLGT